MATAGLTKQFKDALKKYFPTGRAWIGDKLQQVIDAFAVEFCRIQEQINIVLREIDPRKADVLLTDWELMLGIPDECSDLGATQEERINQVVQKLTDTGGSSFEYFEQIAANLGFTVVVSDFTPFRAGQGRAGDSITNHEWDHWFQVTAPADVQTQFRAGQGRAGDRLVEIGNKTLECTFAKLKPAHTNVLFVFT